MLPPFHGDRMRAYEPVVLEAAERELDHWPIGVAVPRASEHAGDHARRSSCAPSSASASADRCTTSCATCCRPRSRRSCRSRSCSGARKQLERLTELAEEIDTLLMSEIAARRRAPGGSDICSLFVAARFEDGSAMDDREIRDQLMTLLLAGHETTATGLAWTLDLLTRNPDVMARAQSGGRGLPARGHRRVAAVAPGRAAGRPPARHRPRGGRRVDPCGDGRHAGDLARPHARRVVSGARTRSARSASWSARPRPTRGSRTAAACAAASAPRSRRWRCGSCSA